MTVTRTIEIYEYIPLQGLRDELDEDEVLIVESINHFVKSVRDMHGGLHKYSWDEVLRYSYADDDFENLQRYVMSDFKEQRNIPDWIWNSRGGGFGVGLPTTSQIPTTIPARKVSANTVQSWVNEKLSGLIANPRLKPASYDALQYWSLYSKQKATITLMEEASRLGDELRQMSVKKSVAYEAVATGVWMALERAVTEKAKTADVVKCLAIRDAITHNGFDWKTFCREEDLTKEHQTQLHQTCREMKPRLFGKIAEDAFKTSAWHKFKKWRERKLTPSIPIHSLVLRVDSDRQ